MEVYCPAEPKAIADLIRKYPIKVTTHYHKPLIFNHYSGFNSFILNPNTIHNILDVMISPIRKRYIDVIKNSQADIVAVNSMTMFWLGPIIRKLGKKSVCFHRETFKSGIVGLRTNIMKFLLKKYFDGLVFISKFDFNEVNAATGIKKVITDKVDMNLYDKNIDKKELRKKAGIDQEAFIVIFLGGTQKLKGGDVVLRALSNVKNENIKLIFMQFEDPKKEPTLNDKVSIRSKLKLIVGKDYHANLVKYIDKNKLWDKIHFIPAVTNPHDYILASDLVVFPSTKPHQARPFYEAGAAKVPIIITEFKQTAEFAKNNVNCLTIKKNDHIALANGILKFMNDSNFYNYIVENNHKQTLIYHNNKSLPFELDEFFDCLSRA